MTAFVFSPLMYLLWIFLHTASQLGQKKLKDALKSFLFLIFDLFYETNN